MAFLPAADSFRLGFEASGVAFDVGSEYFTAVSFAAPEDACTAFIARMMTSESVMPCHFGSGHHEARGRPLDAPQAVLITGRGHAGVRRVSVGRCHQYKSFRLSSGAVTDGICRLCLDTLFGIASGVVSVKIGTWANLIHGNFGTKPTKHSLISSGRTWISALCSPRLRRRHTAWATGHTPNGTSPMRRRDIPTCSGTFLRLEE